MMSKDNTVPGYNHVKNRLTENDEEADLSMRSGAMEEVMSFHSVWGCISVRLGVLSGNQSMSPAFLKVPSADG